MGCLPNLKHNNPKTIISMVSNDSKLFTKENKEIKINHSRLILKVNSNVESEYKILGQLGKGSFGKVVKVLHLKTGLFRAMKIITKDSLEYQDDEKKFLKEIEILIQIDHPNIVKIYEYYEDYIHYYVITEFISGGELYETISSWKDFNEYNACFIMHQIISAVYYLHSNKILHRDLKPENILVESTEKNHKSDQFNIKLIDFGTCNYFRKDKKFSLKVGTPYYIAPEVIKKNYNEKCDLWSCGIIMYVLLTGHPPFRGRCKDEIMSNVLKKKLCLTGVEFEGFSSQSIEFLKKLLTFNDKDRISAYEAINHEWFFNLKKELRDNINRSKALEVLNNIKNFNSKEKLQQATIAYIVHFLSTSEESKEMRKLFNAMDTSGDGRLNYKELKAGFEKFYGKCLTVFELDNIISNIDQDLNGYIEYEEFLRVAINHKTIMSEKNLKLAFDSFDKDNNGKLTIDEIKNVLGTNQNEYVIELFSHIDTNKDGEISYTEFSDLMKKVLANSETINEKMKDFLTVKKKNI